MWLFRLSNSVASVKQNAALALTACLKVVPTLEIPGDWKNRAVQLISDPNLVW